MLFCMLVKSALIIHIKTHYVKPNDYPVLKRKTRSSMFFKDVRMGAARFQRDTHMLCRAAYT